MGRRYVRLQDGSLFDRDNIGFVNVRDSRAIPAREIEGDGSLIKGALLGAKIVVLTLAVAALAYWAVSAGIAAEVRAAKVDQESFSSIRSAHLEEGARLRASGR